MTGPLAGPLPGSNAIGLFVIGVSPIGTITPFNPDATIISQYANSERLCTIIRNFAGCVDQTKNMDSFFDNIWNVNTAVGIGLDIWGRIVGVSRTVHITQEIVYFGFEEATDAEGFGQESFYSGAPLTDNYDLADPAYRQLILAKAFANISDGSIRAINQLLLTIFPSRGGANAYVTDDGDMQMTYTFNFPLSPVEVAIIETSGVFATPVGVSSSIVQNF